MRTTGSWLLAAVWLVCSIGIPLMFWPPEHWTYYHLTVVVTLVAAALRLALLIALGQPRIALGILWFFVYVPCAVVPLAELHTGLYPNLINRSFLQSTQYQILVAMLALEVGVLIYDRRHRAEHVDSRPGGRVIYLPALRWMTALAFAATAYYILRVGGPGAFLHSREDFSSSVVATGLRSNGQAASAVFANLGQVPIAVALVAWLIYWRKNPATRTFNQTFLIWVLVALNLLVNGPIATSRYWFLTVAIGLLFSYPWLTARRFRFTMIAAPIAAALVFPYSDITRTDNHAIQVIGVAEKLSTKDYDQVVMSANVNWYVHTFGHTDGHQLLTSLLFWVPRSAWSGKGLDTGVLIGQLLPSAGTPNLSSPLWSEVYIDFGMVGVGVVFLLLGLLVGWLDARFVELWRSPSSTPFILEALLPLLAGYSLILMRGPLLQASARLAVIVVVCWAISARASATSSEPSSIPELRRPAGHRR